MNCAICRHESRPESLVLKMHGLDDLPATQAIMRQFHGIPFISQEDPK